MVEKRNAPRKPARVRVRFWRAGKPDRVFTGYTMNLSRNGAFIQTDHPIGSGGRAQLEFTTSNHGFLCEAVVTRTKTTPRELRNVKISGMGIQFLTIDDLLRDVLPMTASGDQSATEALSEEARRGENWEFETGDSANDESAQATVEQTQGPPDRERNLEVVSAKVARRHPAAARSPDDPVSGPSTISDWESGAQGRPATVPVTAFRLCPPTARDLATLYQQQLARSHIFVPTERELTDGSTVHLHLVLPGDAGRIELSGSVVAVGARSTAAGVPGVEVELSGFDHARQEIVEFLERNGIHVA